MAIFNCGNELKKHCLFCLPVGRCLSAHPFICWYMSVCHFSWCSISWFTLKYLEIYRKHLFGGIIQGLMFLRLSVKIQGQIGPQKIGWRLVAKEWSSYQIPRSTCFQNFHKIHSRAHQWGQGMECVLWGQSLICILHLLSSYHVWYVFWHSALKVGVYQTTFIYFLRLYIENFSFVIYWVNIIGNFWMVILTQTVIKKIGNVCDTFANTLAIIWYL